MRPPKSVIFVTKYIFGQSAQNATFHTHIFMMIWYAGSGREEMLLYLLEIIRVLSVLCNKNSPTRIENLLLENKMTL